MPGFNITVEGVVCRGDSTPANTSETSRRHRYILQVLQPLSRDLLIVSHKCGRPTPEIDRIVMHHGQDEIYMPGKNRWLPIEISFYDVHSAGGTDNTAKEIYNWWSASVLDIEESAISQPFKRDGNLYLLDSAGRPVWEYQLLGTWPSKVSPDSLDYSDNSISEITVTLQMDKCREVVRENADRAVNADPCEPTEPLPVLRRVIIP
jgi:hypothetical protein